MICDNGTCHEPDEPDAAAPTTPSAVRAACASTAAARTAAATRRPAAPARSARAATASTTRPAARLHAQHRLRGEPDLHQRHLPRRLPDERPTARPARRLRRRRLRRQHRPHAAVPQQRGVRRRSRVRQRALPRALLQLERLPHVRRRAASPATWATASKLASPADMTDSSTAEVLVTSAVFFLSSDANQFAGDRAKPIRSCGVPVIRSKVRPQKEENTMTVKGAIRCVRRRWSLRRRHAGRRSREGRRQGEVLGHQRL